MQVLHNLPAGDWAKGERGIACHPDRGGRISGQRRHSNRIRQRAGLQTSELPRRDYAGERSAGKTARNLCRQPEIRRAKIQGSRHQAIDRTDQQHPRHAGVLSQPHTAGARHYRDVGSDNLFVQYDIYHMQIMEGDLASTIEKNLAMIPHMQLADNPGRHEPGTGEINYAFCSTSSTSSATPAGSAARYKPLTTTEAGLSWMEKLSGIFNACRQ